MLRDRATGRDRCKSPEGGRAGNRPAIESRVCRWTPPARGGGQRLREDEIYFSGCSDEEFPVRCPPGLVRTQLFTSKWNAQHVGVGIRIGRMSSNSRAYVAGRKSGDGSVCLKVARKGGWGIAPVPLSGALPQAPVQCDSLRESLGPSRAGRPIATTCKIFKNVRVFVEPAAHQRDEMATAATALTPLPVRSWLV
jgi:hypothetical protein